MAFSSRRPPGAEAHAQKAHEQPVGGLGLVLDAEFDLHDVLKGRDVPEAGFDACLRWRFTKNLLQLLLLRPLELCRVLVASVTGYHGAQPVSPPFRQPLAYRLLGPLDHLRDNIQANAAGSVHNRFRLHSHQLVGIRTLLPPDEDVPFLVVMSICMRLSYSRPSVNANQESRDSCPRMPFCLIPAIPFSHPTGGRAQ